MTWIFADIFTSPSSILVAVLLVLLTWHYLQMLLKRRGLPPGPVPLPFIGTLYTIPTNLSDIPFLIADLAKKYGGMCTLQGPDGGPMVVISNISDVKEAFAKSTDVAGRPLSRGLYSQMLFNPLYPVAGIAFSDYDDQLKLQRSISMVVLRSLGYGKKSIENKIMEEAEHLISAFENFKGASFRPKTLLDSAVANIICSLLFGDRYEYGDKEFTELQHCVEKIFEFMGTSSLIDDLWFVKYIPSQRKRIEEFKKVSDYFNNFAWRKIEETKKHMKSGEESSDFISGYLKEIKKSEGKLQDRSQQLVKDFFGAGSETTATALGWILYFMLKYPEVQQKIRNEINSVVGKGAKPALKDREKLPYTEATIIEVLRVTPTAPTSLPHWAITDTEIGGYKISKGTEVMAITLPKTWDEKMFPDPQTLRPERHLDKDGQFVKNENLTPFGIGRRSCLGEHLARQELFLFFTHLIQSFEFKMPEGETLPPQKGAWFITYRPPEYNLLAIPL